MWWGPRLGCDIDGVSIKLAKERDEGETMSSKLSPLLLAIQIGNDGNDVEVVLVARLAEVGEVVTGFDKF